eukprot:s1627_g1.t1
MRRIRSCSWNREGESPKEGREPFPSPGGYIRLNVTDDSPTADPARVVESPAPGPSKQALKVFAFTSMWWIAAIMVILEIKQVVHDIFPFPFALTAMVQPTTALCAWLLSRLVHSKRPPAPPLQSHENMYVVVIGLVQGLEIGLTNKALEFLTVAARTMISSTSVLFMMCTARFWGLERLGLLRLCSSALMIMGGVFQCHVPELPGGRSSAHWLGMLMQMISMILSAQRWALAQFVLQRSPVGSGLAQTTKLQLLARPAPLAIWTLRYIGEDKKVLLSGEGLPGHNISGGLVSGLTCLALIKSTLSQPDVPLGVPGKLPHAADSRNGEPL